MIAESSIKNMNPALRLRKRISVSLLIFAAIGLIGCWFWGIHGGGAAQQILEHAFEGALVGGLCDWFAVKKTYSAIKSNHSAVAEGIGTYIKQEILNAGNIRVKLTAMLDSPDVMSAFRQRTISKLESRDQIAQALSDQWRPRRLDVYSWLASLDLTDSGYDQLNEILSDKIVVATAKNCLIKAIKESVESDAFMKLEDHLREQLLNIVVDLAAKAFYTNRKRYFTHFAGQMADGTIDQKTADLLLSAFSHFKSEYLKTWNHLTIKDRQVAVEHLVDPLVGQLIKAIATVVYGETEKIQAASTLRAFAPARLAVEWIVDHLADDQMDVVAKAVVDTLKKIDSGEFAKTFESHTRLYLELIRINGTGLGFLLGGLLGFLL